MNQAEFEGKVEELTPTQKQVLKLFLAGKKDEEIATTRNCTRTNVQHHISNVAKTFSLKPKDEDYTRCRPELIELFIDYQPGWVCSEYHTLYSGPKLEPASPGPPVGLNSPFYVDPKGVLERCLRETLKPGALVRIRAPKKTGKTSLLKRLLDAVSNKGYRLVYINLQDVDKQFLTDLDQFLRWFCSKVSDVLGLDRQLDTYWDKEAGSISNSTTYFQAGILSKLDTPLVLALDEVDRLFEYPQVYDFFTLLRRWNDEANNLEVWENLRTVVTYSTGVYIKLDIHQSPFNAGVPITLPSLNAQQIQSLAQRYGIKAFGDKEAQDLIAMVGGQPYLVQLALYELANGEQSLQQLLNVAPTQAGIYRNHLQSLWEQLQSSPNASEDATTILDSLKRVLETGDGGVRLQEETGFKLEGMGLVQFDGDQVRLSCELYRRYFRKRLQMDS